MTDGPREAADAAPPGTSERIEALREEARSAVREGRLVDAYGLATEATTLGAERLGLLHPTNTESYLLVSELAGWLGQPAISIVYAENAFSTVEESLEPDNPVVGDVLRAMGVAYGRAGDYETAETLLQAASEVHEEAHGSDAPEVATDLLALSRLYLGSDDPRALRGVPELLGRARAIRAASFDARSVELAEVWQLQGETIAAMFSPDGDNDGLSRDAVVEACDTALRIAGEILEEHFEHPHPIFARLYQSRGDMYLKIGRRDLAFDAYGKALEANADQPTSDVALRFASLAAAQGDADLTLAACRAANALSRTRFDEFARWADIADKAKYRRRSNPAHQICLSLVHGLDLNADEKAAAMADIAITWRAAASRSERVRLSRLREEADEALANDAGALDVRRRALAASMVRTIRTGDVPLETISDQLDEVRRFEEIIALQSLVPTAPAERGNPTVRAVADGLASDSAMVIFQRVDHFDPITPFSPGADRYVALIVRPDAAVQLEDYGDVAELDGPVLDALTDLRSANRLHLPPQLDAVSRLHRLIWEPIAAALGPYPTVFIVTDGPMALVPFAALRDGSGRFLIETKRIIHLTSPVDLLNDPRNGVEPELDAIVVGDPEFGPAEDQGDEQPFSFAALTGAARELEAIRPHMQGDIRPLPGALATKDAIRESPGARFVHFATHGYFLREDQIASLRDVDRALSDGGHDSIAREIDLVRSGLALARANEGLPGEPGILTAMEIAGMDFSDTELVTLSACETGVGRVEADEGVIGLRQAFELAGAGNLIMSLWVVKGRELQKQMAALYEMLGAGRSPAEALHEVQKMRIAWYREHLEEAPPAVWGAFIVQAHRWGPLTRQSIRAGS